MRDKVTVQAPAYQDDGAGGRQRTGWTNIIVGLWARVQPISGGETFRFGVDRSTQFYRIEVRFREDINTSCRLLLSGVPLNIRTCDDPTRTRESLLILAESGVADG